MARPKRDPTKPPFNPFYTTFWDDTWAWPDDEQLAAIHLLTCRERAAEGLFLLRPGMAAETLGAAWPVDRVEEAWTGLVRRAWLLRDAPTGWMLIVNALRWDQPYGGPQVTGAVRRVAGAPRDSKLWPVFMAAARLWSPPLFTALGGHDNGGDPHREFTDSVSWCLSVDALDGPAVGPDGQAILGVRPGTVHHTLPGTVPHTVPGTVPPSQTPATAGDLGGSREGPSYPPRDTPGTGPESSSSTSTSAHARSGGASAGVQAAEHGLTVATWPQESAGGVG